MSLEAATVGLEQNNFILLSVLTFSTKKSL